jgi:hypothetical protein
MYPHPAQFKKRKEKKKPNMNTNSSLIKETIIVKLEYQ